jgi:parallel beta-helix repeat protein
VGQPFDLQGFVDNEIKAGTPRIVIPPGRYRVTPRDRQHLVLRNLKDRELIADGVEMICTETTRALTVANCTNVTVRGLVIDYDPLPFTQGRLTAISADQQDYEISLFDGYPTAGTVRNFKYEVFRPDTRTLRCDDRYPTKIEVLDERHLRLTWPGGRDNSPEQVGDLIVIGSESAAHGSIPHAVECNHNSNVRLENITLFASNCFGFLETDCDGSVYQRCRIDRREPADDPVKRASPRLRSLDADAFHSKYATKGPSYLACTARFMGDDCINICGDYHLIMAVQGKDLRVLAKGHLNIQPGDPVELVGYDGVRLPDATAVSIQAAGPILDGERAFLGQQQMDANLKSGRGLSQAFTVTLDREVDLARGSVLCAANRVGNGFAVRDCTFGFNRSRGILIKASHGEITGNRLEGNRMSAILVAPEYWWLEAGSSSEVIIANNTISSCGGVPIRIEATGGNGRVAPAGAHRNLTVTGNTVSGCAMPGILVTSTAGLRIGNNTLGHWTAANGIPDAMRRAGLSELKPVVEIHCQP